MTKHEMRTNRTTIDELTALPAGIGPRMEVLHGDVEPAEARTLPREIRVTSS